MPNSPPLHHPADILRRGFDWLRDGRHIVLITLTGIAGVASRVPGTLMVVADDGSHAGSFSGGCIEAAIVSEALEVLAAGRGRAVRYGVGSHYIDVRLPCGGGIDLLFTPRPDPRVLSQALALLDAREPAALSVNANEVALVGGSSATVGFVIQVPPPLRILAYGHGDDLAAFVHLGRCHGALVEAVTPDPQAAERLRAAAITAHHVLSRTQIPPMYGDPWTAVVFLFHDHDWEESLLPSALSMPAFYYGAIGSARTHDLRLEMLRHQDVSETLITQLRGRIGLIPSTRDPALLALSILAEIAAVYRDVTDQPKSSLADPNGDPVG
ncbi:MAG: XdhC family protein [Sphingobium sp.]|nr:XdhC family protein [Sphingomonas sp.]